MDSSGNLNRALQLVQDCGHVLAFASYKVGHVYVAQHSKRPWGLVPISTA